MSHVQVIKFDSPPHSAVNHDNIWSRKQRKVHHKVKTGCKACKLRRQKCDEKRPICTGCRRHSTECLYLVRGRSPGKNSGDEKPAVSPPAPPSPANSLAALPSSEMNLGDLELLHQFLTSTCIATGQLPEVTDRLQMTVPALAQEHPFVMHGILAMAATHLSRLRPSRQAYYAALGAKNHDQALPRFQSTLREMNSENCHALIFYSKSLVWCSMASGEHRDVDAGSNWLPQWFYLLRGSCLIVKSSKIWLEDGPFRSHKLDDFVNHEESPDDERIRALLSQYSFLNESMLCKTVFLALREAFTRASMHQHNTPYRNAINFWISSLPNEYVSLLQTKEPWALVVLAHFCVLLHRSESVWFMKGQAARLMSLIVEFLDSNWRQLVQWPCQEIGIG